MIRVEMNDCADPRSSPDPCSVINYVARSKMMVVNSLDVLGDNFSDPYLAKHHPRSILCLALANHQRLIGVLYMENSQTNEAFVSRHRTCPQDTWAESLQCRRPID